MTSPQLLLMTMIDGDMDDIVEALKYQETRGPPPPPKPHHTHCSALVQLSPGADDLFIAHVNWDSYQSMLRIIKYLDMPLPNAKARRMSFDSYPGSLSSMSDFYRTSAGLTVTETTLDMDNPSLWPKVTPESIMVWMRGMLANRLASSGDEWTDICQWHNSGTCNNQWIAALVITSDGEGGGLAHEREFARIRASLPFKLLSLRS